MEIDEKIGMVWVVVTADLFCCDDLEMAGGIVTSSSARSRWLWKTANIEWLFGLGFCLRKIGDQSNVHARQAGDLEAERKRKKWTIDCIQLEEIVVRITESKGG